MMSSACEQLSGVFLSEYNFFERKVLIRIRSGIFAYSGQMSKIFSNDQIEHIGMYLLMFILVKRFHVGTFFDYGVNLLFLLSERALNSFLPLGRQL